MNNLVKALKRWNQKRRIVDAAVRYILAPTSDPAIYDYYMELKWAVEDFTGRKGYV